jgi:uncharacterized protein with beta-barrel porin domain
VGAGSAVLGLWLGVAATAVASAQSLDIPLQLAQSSDGVRLIVNIGIDGQLPRSYMFDTGSSIFNAAYSASAFGSIPSNMSAPSALYPTGLPTGVSYSYTSGNTFTGNLVSTPSLTFYATTSAASGVTLNATAPGGAASGFTINAVYDRNGSPISTQTPLQSIPGVFGGIYGIFGAGDFATYRTGTNPGQPGVTPNTTTAVVGGVLGQAVVAGTTAGYVVAANGQPLSGLATGPGVGPNPGSTVNGPQVGQNVTSCSPCVMLGLTPALIAQFSAVNTLNWIPTPGKDPQTFPNSGAPASTEYGVRMNFSASAPGHSASWTGLTLLDTGTPSQQLASTTANLSGLGTVTPTSTLNPGVTLTMSGTAAGASATTQTVTPSGAFPYTSPYGATVGDGSNDNIVGVSFFLANSVLYNLSGQAIGYTPNFVTNTDITTTSASPLTVGSSSVPLGLAGNISGPGGVFVTAGGSATLSGTNTYTGPTSITGANAYLALVGPGSIAASSGVTVSAGGLFDISGTNSGATIATLAGDAAGYVELGAQMLTLSNASTSFAGVIDGAGGGLHVAGGVQTLTGTSSYTGPTIVDGSGMLLVNGSIVSSIGTSVLTGGTLGGNGMVGAVAIGDGGTLMPGLPGTAGGVLTIAGPLSMTGGANYLANVSPSAASRAQIVGTALIAGTLTAYGTGGAYTSGATYNVFTASGGFTGSFTAFKVAGSFGSMTPTFSTDADDVFLTLHPADLVSHLPAGASGNALAIAQAITAANVGTPPLSIQNLFALPPSQLAAALTQISGETAVGSQQATFSAMNTFMGTMLDPFNRGTTSTSTPGGGGNGYASEADTSAYASDGRQRTSAERDAYAMFTKAPLAQTYDPRWSVWAAGFGGSQTTDGNASVGSNNTASSIYGTAVGADYRLSPFTVAGFSMAGGGTSFSVANGGSGHSDLFQVGAFVKHSVGAAYVSAALAYGWQDITTNRTVTASGTDQLRAQFDANAFSGRLEGGYRFVAPWIGGIGITPYAAAQFTTFDLPGYAEQAIVGSNAFALAYNAKDVTDTRSELGIRTDKSFAMTDGILTLRGRVAWAHDYDPERSIATTFQSLPGASFVVNGAAQASDSALVTASVEKKWLTGWSAAATFEGEFSDVTRSYAGKGVVRYTW